MSVGLLLRVLSVAVAVTVGGCAGTSCRTCRGTIPYAQIALLFSDSFSRDLSNWVAEGGRPELTRGEMELDTPVGSTVWFKHELSGNVLIEYDVTVLRMGGANDRVSDMNCFWMATDPAHPDDLFAAGPQREGVFASYHGLSLYYVGYGSNTNTTTRFRRYRAGRRELLGEHTDPVHLIVPNHTYHIQLVVCDGVVEYYCDGERLFRYEDPEPYRRGHFGLCTVENHLSMDNFRVVRIGPVQ